VPKSKPPHIKKEPTFKSNKSKTQYQKRDQQILIVATYLVSKRDVGATVYNIIKNREVGLSSQDQSRFTEIIMNPMEKNGWVKRTTYSPRVSIYKITENGEAAVSEALRLRSEGNLLSTLEAFQGITRD